MQKTRHFKKVYQKTRIKTWGGRLFKTAFLLSVLLGVGLVGLFIYYAKDLPRPEKFTELTIPESTKIYDREGTILLYELFAQEKRDIVPLAEVSDNLKYAVLATEDAGFYSHFGISIKGTLRALLTNLGLRPSQLRVGSSQGGSTISQQLIRSSFLTRQKTIERKIREIILTVELERNYSKDKILEFYLNQIFMGSNTYGIGAASQLYFHKQPSELSLGEAAVLAALIQAPSYYSPYGTHVDDLLLRKDHVLNRMAEEGFITKETAMLVKQEEIVFKDPSSIIRAPHFVFYMLDQLLETYEEDFVRQNGLSIRTTLDWDLQQLAEELVSEYAARNTASRAYNAALVALNPQTGEILAMVGSKDWFGESFPEGCTPGQDCLFDPKVNVATFSPGRQPGSAFKPFVYATAFEKGHDDQVEVIDEETNFGVWGGKEYIPQNYDEQFRGPVTLRQSLAQSLNVPSVKVLADLAGVTDSITTAKALGITTLTQDPSFYVLSLVLGGGEVKLLELTSAYGVFAAEGRRAPSQSILAITDSRGRALHKGQLSSLQVISSGTAQLITSILSDNEARTPMFGPNSVLYFPDRQVAVKTGTTQEYRDAWTIGYTPDIVVGIWVGNNNNAPTSKRPGVMLSAPLWRAFIEEALFILAKRTLSPTE